MKYLFTAFLILLSQSLMAEDDKLKVKNGIDPVEINSETEIGDLSYVFDINKETVKALSMANLPSALDDKFSNTPFLYFFNGIIPKENSHLICKDLDVERLINFDGNCLADSSVMTSPGVYDSSRNQKFKQFSTEAFDGKEPQSDSRKK